MKLALYFLALLSVGTGCFAVFASDLGDGQRFWGFVMSLMVLAASLVAASNEQ